VKQVAVIGSSGAGPGSEAWELACRVGELLGGAGVALVCGGGPGVMEAASKEAVNAGGTAIAVLPGESLDDATLYYTHVVATGVGHARNLAVVASGEAVIAIGGEWGTLSEFGLARVVGRTVIALRSWGLSSRGEMEGAPGVLAVETPEEAVAAALEAIGA
jgi:uncharacterized protein (TIGR00725 family)